MSTGVTSRKMIKKAKPIEIVYEGKQSINTVLNSDFKTYNYSIPVNGGGYNYLYFDDNINVLRYLINNGYRNKIDLVYIDPPFATKSDFLNRNQEHAYSDSLSGAEYVEFLRERIILLYELLSDRGSIYVHLDNNMAFTMKIIMDEIFGEKYCQAFITRKKCSTKNYTKNTYGNISDYILFYSKSDKYTWNRPYDPWSFDKMIEQYPCVDESGNRYKKVPLHAPGIRNGETGKEWRGMLPPKGKHWQYTPEKLDELDALGEIYWSPTGNPRRKVYCDINKGIPIQDIWINYRDCINQAQKTTGYPTEKNIDMLKMIVQASSNKGDLVLDCFAGSGTTLAAAFELDRKWIGVDSSRESMKAILKRFTKGLDVYGDYVNTKESDNLLFDLYEKCPFNIIVSEENQKSISFLEEIKGL